MSFRRTEWEAEKEDADYQSSQLLNEDLKRTAAAMGVDYEQYKLGYELWILNGTRAGAERRKLELEKAEREAHHKEQQRRATIRNASVSELMSSLVAKAPTEMFPDVQTYRTTGELSSRLIDWISHANNDYTRQ